MSVANIHIRNLPPEALETLRVAARRHRRSLNAEIVAALVERATHEQKAEDLLERTAEVRRRFREAFPDGFPLGFEPETIIRRARDAR